MTEPQDDIATALAKLRAKKAPAPPEDIGAALAKIRATSPDPHLHARAVAREMTNANEADQAALAQGGPMESLAQGIETTVNALPLGGRLMAGARALGQHIPFQQAANEQNAEIANYKSENPRASVALQALANVPLFTNLPGKILQGGRGAGAAVGATSAAAQRLGSTDHEGESLADRLKGTATDAAVGGGVGYAAPWLAANPVTRTAIGGAAGAFFAPDGYRLPGAAVGAAAAASPSTTAALVKALATKAGASRIAAAAGALRNATGTRGVVNAEMEGINRLAKPTGGIVGAESSAGAQKVARAEWFANQSRANYAKAAADTKVLSDPKTVALIHDPDIEGGFAAVDRIRNAKGIPLPQVVTGQRQVPSAIMQPNGQPYTYTQDVMGKVPDPEALHTLKRIVRDVVDNGFSKESTIPLEDALRMQPKLQELTQQLHAVSPDYRMADRFHQLGMTSGDATDLGYGALKPGMQNPTAKNLGTKDVAGVKDFIASQTHADAGQAAALRSAAQKGVASGARGQLSQQLAAKGLAGGRAGVLATPVFDVANPAAAAQRSLAQIPGYEQTLADVTAETAASAPKTGLLSRAVSSVTRGHVNIAPKDQVGDALSSPEGKRLLAEVVRNPQQYQGTLQSFLRGKQSLVVLKRLMQAEAGARAGQQ